jgi:ribonuclease HII
MNRSTTPTLREERSLLRAGHRVVAGMDEVGRGALAGPVSVGAVAVDLNVATAPAGLRDSKLLRPSAREALLPKLSRWGLARAVGHASPAEIDEFGLMAGLRLAGFRALEQIAAAGIDVDLVLLDGNHDWLTPPISDGLFDLADFGGRPVPQLPNVSVPAVTTRIKADLSCASVAAASVLAKCERDALMVEAASRWTAYGWAENKGYAAVEHRDALRSLGPCVWHRRSWNLDVGDSASDAVAAAVGDDLAGGLVLGRDVVGDEVAGDEVAGDEVVWNDVAGDVVIGRNLDLRAQGAGDRVRATDADSGRVVL